jgi:hypothetical protein
MAESSPQPALLLDSEEVIASLVNRARARGGVERAAAAEQIAAKARLRLLGHK